jgi:hypothetical protein
LYFGKGYFGGKKIYFAKEWIYFAKKVIRSPEHLIFLQTSIYNFKSTLPPFILPHNTLVKM